jgi:hypothetical protein
MWRLQRVWRSGSTGWIALGAGVLTWNATHTRTGETLSSAYTRGLRHPVARWAVLAGWGVVTLHLLAFLPQRADPLHWAGASLNRYLGEGT